MNTYLNIAYSRTVHTDGYFQMDVLSVLIILIFIEYFDN